MQDMLAYLQSLGKDGLLIMLTNWYRGLHGKFKVPVFAHVELDLHKIFFEVQSRGGYDVVTNDKQWKVSSIIPLGFLIVFWFF